MVFVPKAINLTGEHFGRLKVEKRADDAVSKTGRRRARWLCKCDCGNTVVVYGDNLKKGATTSCGCYQRELYINRFVTHGETHTRLYGIWCAMKSRCTNKNTKYYGSYGGRGITVCEEWIKSFENFKTWAYKHGYDDNLSIDRIDNNSGYSPHNCRWVTSVAQANNRRSNVNITYNGETHNVTEWASIIGKSPKTLFNRLYSGWTVERILTT